MNDDRKIGIILDCAPHDGGSFQYALSMLYAVRAFSSKRSFQLIVFFRGDGWKRYIEECHADAIRLNGDFIKDIVVIDSQNCEFIVGTAQMGWSHRLSTPVVEPIHDLMHIYEPGFSEVSNDGEGENRNILLLSVAEKAFGILVDSKVGKRQVEEIYGRCYCKKIYVLPFCAPKYLDEEIEKIDISLDKYFFYPAQFWTHKNHKSIIHAVSNLRRKGIKISFIFVGSPKNGYDETVDLIRDLKLEGQIQMLGYVSNAQMRFLYENARALIMPTFFGPTNIPPIEAITLGCPVAVSKIYGMPEQLEDAALYFDPSNVEELSIVLERLWNDDSICEELKKKGELIRNKFSQETFNMNFERIGEIIIDYIGERNSLLGDLIGFCRSHPNIYIYGAGEYSYKIFHILKQNHIMVRNLIVSNASDEKLNENVFNKAIKAIREIEFESGDGIICAVSEKYMEDVLGSISAAGIDDSDIFTFNKEWLDKAIWKSGL